MSARQRSVLPLPAGPRRNCACTAEFLTQRREEAKAQRDFISVFDLRETSFPQFHLLACAFGFCSTGFSAQRRDGEKQFIFSFGKNRPVAGRNFYSLRSKLSYHFQRFGNWNCRIKQ
jgi:hypothetical protein